MSNIDDMAIMPAGKTIEEYVEWLELKVKDQAKEIKQLHGSAKDMAKLLHKVK